MCALSWGGTFSFVSSSSVGLSFACFVLGWDFFSVSSSSVGLFLHAFVLVWDFFFCLLESALADTCICFENNNRGEFLDFNILSTACSYLRKEHI